MVDLPELPFIDTVMTTIVFYGYDRRLPVGEAKSLIENLCLLLNERPSHAHVGFERRRGRAPKFGMLDKAIIRGELEDYTNIEAVNYFAKGNVADCSLAVRVKNDIFRLIEIHFKKERQMPVDINLVLKGVLDHISPDYGVAYNLSVREGPRWFISGIISSGMPKPLGRASGEFRNEYFFGKKFTDGFFRDVFRWNYLCPVHLDRMIEGVRFRDWVEEPSCLVGARARGKLSFLDNGCAVWELTPSEASEVRRRMLVAGLLMVKN